MKIKIICILLIIITNSIDINSLSLNGVYYAAASYCNPLTEILPWNCDACKHITGVVLTKPFFHASLKDFTLGYVTYNIKDNLIVVSFRGTNGLPTAPNFNSILSILNWRTNLDAALVDYETFNSTIKDAKVHRGFLNSYNSIKKDLFTSVREILRIKDDANIQVTGHSLGGALSTLAIVDLYNELHNRTKGNWYLTTYGSPRVGNKEFSKYFDEKIKNAFRHVHNGDITVQVPLITQNYVHVKRELWYEHNSLNYVVCQENEDPLCNLSQLDRSIEEHALYLKIPITAMCSCSARDCPNRLWGNCCENTCPEGCSGNCDKVTGCSLSEQSIGNPVQDFQPVIV